MNGVRFRLGTVGVRVLAVAALIAGAGLAAGGTALAGTAAPTVTGVGTPAAIDGSYIVTLKSAGTDPARLAARYGGTVTHTYGAALHGFAAHLTAAQAQRLVADPAVAGVEQNQRVGLAEQRNAENDWNLDRIDQPFPLRDDVYHWPTAQPGDATVHVYVVDSGIKIAHPGFAGRATNGYDFVDNDGTAQDCNGHGTRVAGLVGADEIGVNVQAQLVAVRVAGCAGTTDAATVLAGIDWVTAHAVKPAVANLSLSFTTSVPAITTAVKAAIASGVTVVVAAGNTGTDSCQLSPANIPAALVVAASDEVDRRATFSSFGACVDLFAPGTGLETLDLSGAYSYASGTSFAAPQVAGDAAFVLAAHPTYTPAEVAQAIVDASSPVIRDAGAATTSRLLQVVGTAKPTTFALRSRSTTKIVTTGTSGADALVASRYTVGASELFDVVDAGSGAVALRGHGNGRYVTAAGSAPLVADATTIGTDQRFTLVTNPDGSISLLAQSSGRYVSATAGSPLVASATAISAKERFDITGAAPAVALIAKVPNAIVTTPEGGTKALIANGGGIGDTEIFDVIDAGGGYVALLCHANGRYVTAGDAGTKSLFCNGTAIGNAQKFGWIDGADGLKSLQAAINGKYVTATSTSTPLIASASTITASETFAVYTDV